MQTQSLNPFEVIELIAAIKAAGAVRKGYLLTPALIS
jgi:hypothetical protein